MGERMSRKATEFQKKEMSRMYRGKEIFKPLNVGSNFVKKVALLA